MEENLRRGNAFRADSSETPGHLDAISAWGEFTTWFRTESS